MPTATLTVELPENVWVSQVSSRYPEAQIRVLAAVADQMDGVVMVEIRADEVDNVLQDIWSADDVSDVTVLERGGSTLLAQIETRSAVLLHHAQQSGVPIEMPFTVSDGRTVWELTASHDRLSELGTLLASDDIPFTVESITHDVDRDDLLTDTQLEVVATAIREGYYDTPRTCTQTELAETLGLAKSTCSETLHRAEERIVKRFVDQHPDDIDIGATADLHSDKSGTVAPGQAD